jgi:aminomethyltransferase
MKTALYMHHVALGAKMAPFAGWQMPIQYKGVIAEHQAVRKAVGIFDVSHMGRILIEGKETIPFLNYLSTNKLTGKKDGSATYTVWCQEKGGSVDDLIVYQQSSTSCFIILNASNRDKDLNHLVHYAAHFDVNIQERFHEEGILSLQGPLAELLLAQFFPQVQNIKPMHFVTMHFQEHDLIISRSGYTGAGGFEIYASRHQIVYWWEMLLKAGKIFGIEPIGLAARDTLRLEMGFALYGHELSERIAPNESVAAWAVKWHKEDFLGKAALEKIEHSPNKRYAYGIELLDKGIARENFLVFKEDQEIGYVTSGSFSPTLNKAIALILVNAPLKMDEIIQVQIRQQLCRAQVVQIPFIRKVL